MPAAFSAVGQREVRERWRAGGTGEREGVRRRVATGGQARGDGNRAEDCGEMRGAAGAVAGLVGFCSRSRVLVGCPTVGH